MFGPVRSIGRPYRGPPPRRFLSASSPWVPPIFFSLVSLSLLLSLFSFDFQPCVGRTGERDSVFPD